MMTSISSFTHGDGYCGTKVPWHPPHGDPGPFAVSKLHSLLSTTALNPQPLPPKESGSGHGSIFADEFCGTGPHIPHIPGFPPRPPHTLGF